ncbi:MAG: antitoxin VapB family protein [Thaumarchaeota archaeon]|nr:antitoxin VapB family protein [Nitrososphaerota archaeon]
MVRQVSLSEDAYLKLKRSKKPDESFSDAIVRLLETRSGDLDRFVGAWKDEDTEKIERQIMADRRASKSRGVHFG